jgi:hypothetical protein
MKILLLACANSWNSSALSLPKFVNETFVDPEYREFLRQRRFAPGGPACKHAGARSGAGGRRARCIGLRTGRVSGALDVGNNVHGSLLLLADNLFPATTDQTTKARRHKGTRKEIQEALQLGDPCELPAAAPGSRRAACCGARVPASARGRGHPGLR